MKALVDDSKFLEMRENWSKLDLIKTRAENQRGLLRYAGLREKLEVWFFGETGKLPPILYVGKLDNDSIMVLVLHRKQLYFMRCWLETQTDRWMISQDAVLPADVLHLAEDFIEMLG